jgi:hypothetical protein
MLSPAMGQRKAQVSSLTKVSECVGIPSKKGIVDPAHRISAGEELVCPPH